MSGNSYVQTKMYGGVNERTETRGLVLRTFRSIDTVLRTLNQRKKSYIITAVHRIRIPFIHNQSIRNNKKINNRQLLQDENIAK